MKSEQPARRQPNKSATIWSVLSLESVMCDGPVHCISSEKRHSMRTRHGQLLATPARPNCSASETLARSYCQFQETGSFQNQGPNTDSKQQGLILGTPTTQILHLLKQATRSLSQEHIARSTKVLGQTRAMRLFPEIGGPLGILGKVPATL